MEYSVKTSDGKRRIVHVIDDLLTSPSTQFAGLPPNTSRMPPVANVLRGENFHGSLDEDLYVILNEPSDPSRYVMWAGNDGSQDDDDAPRLYMVSWCDLPDADDEGPDYEGPNTFLKSAAEALLYGYFRFIASYDSIDEIEVRCSEARVLTEDCANDMHAQAIHDARKETITKRR